VKSNRPPDPATLKLATHLKNDPQVIKWTQRILGDEKARPTDLTEDQLAFVHREVAKLRGGVPDEDAYARAMVKTCPQFAAPDFTNLEDDFEILFSQPEMIKFWQDWEYGYAGTGPTANYRPSKALMAVLGMGGVTAHADTAHETYTNSTRLKSLFSTIEGETVGDIGYSTALNHFKVLGPTCTTLAIEANIEMMKALRAMHPDKGIGERLLLDSSSVPAWCQQRSSGGNDEMEKFLNRRTPEAHFKIYTYGGKDGKVEQSPSAQVSAAALRKKWRGYFFSTIVDQATGMPLVWMLHKADNEMLSIVPLLSLLYRLWPDCPAEMLVADAHWDVKEWHRLCEVDYGIHPIFRQQPSTKTKSWTAVGAHSRDGSVSHITSQGQLVCTEHAKPIKYDSFDPPSRAGLAPGQSSDEGKFRARGNCLHSTNAHPVPCGRIGVRANFNWRRLTYYPHFSEGHKERYAMRHAMLSRLNQVESVFNRLKGGKYLGNSGAGRTRITDKGTVEGLFSLACLSMTASLVADERLKLKKSSAPKTAVPQQSSAKALKKIGLAKPKPKSPAVSAPTLAASSATAAVVAVPGVGVFKRGRRRVNLEFV